MDRGILGRQVAIKQLPVYLRSDALSTTRFEHEARMAARVRHPNLVTVYDYDLDDDGSPFLVMEYVRGQTLSELPQAERSLSRICSIGILLCDALAALHARRVVHRDVKPSNIMVAERREGLTLKLVDFGLAKLVPRRGAVSRHPEPVCGTPQYMAPEQILGACTDARTDVFALGCVLYELFTGAPPAGRAARQLILTRQLYSPPRPPTARGAKIGRGLERALLKALAKEPEARPDSALEIRDALTEASGA